MLTRIAVWDLDGVLADVRHRLEYVESYPKDWDSFFAAAVRDSVLEQGRILLEEHRAAGLTITYLSGRPERCRADTVLWLSQNGLPTGDLLLRPARDYRPAYRVKLDHLESLAHTHEIVTVVDDDPTVVEALLAAGFPVRRATWMTEAESQPLWVAQEQEGRT